LVVLAVGRVQTVLQRHLVPRAQRVKVLLAVRETMGRFNIPLAVAVVLARLEVAHRQTPQTVGRVGRVSLPRLLVRLLVAPVVAVAQGARPQRGQQRMAVALAQFSTLSQPLAQSILGVAVVALGVALGRNPVLAVQVLSFSRYLLKP
jgi:hypothetical protein